MNSVWVQLYIGEEKFGNIFEIEPLPKNVNALKNATKDAYPVLSQIFAAELKVFPAGTSVPVEEFVTSLDPGSTVEPTDAGNPLVIVAPAPLPQQKQFGGDGLEALASDVKKLSITQVEWLKKLSIAQEEWLKELSIAQEEGLNKLAIAQEEWLKELSIAQEEGLNKLAIAQEEGLNKLAIAQEEGLNKLAIEIHTLREMMPTVIVGQVITPSKASQNPQVVVSVFESLKLTVDPIKDTFEFMLPRECGSEWDFSWHWPKEGGGLGDDKCLERTSYEPVVQFLEKIFLFGYDVSEGQYCIEKLLFNAEVVTCRLHNPLQSGQTVYFRHRVAGRTDIVVLTRDCRKDTILRFMIKFVIEIKTVAGYEQSTSGCMREAQLQLIGLNAFNTNCSPPVVLTNLATKHRVLYLDADEELRYSIRVRDCESFPAAIYFAKHQGEKECISQHFSRPTTPASYD